MKDTSVLMNEFKKGTYESLLKDIYVDVYKRQSSWKAEQISTIRLFRPER